MSNGEIMVKTSFNNVHKEHLLMINAATKHKVATAATNGAIILWDLNKVGRKSGKCNGIV